MKAVAIRRESWAGVGRRVASPASGRTLGPSPGHGCSALAGMGCGHALALKETFPAMAAAAVAAALIPRGSQSLSHHFCPFFQKPLSRCPSSNHARAAVNLATHSPEPARAVTSALRAGGLFSGLPNPPLLHTGRSGVWGNSLTNAVSQPEGKTQQPGTAPFAKCKKNENARITHRVVPAWH